MSIYVQGTTLEARIKIAEKEKQDKSTILRLALQLSITFVHLFLETSVIFYV